jgi:hypothetical protein
MDRLATCLLALLLPSSVWGQTVSLDGDWQLYRGAESALPSNAEWQTVRVPLLLGQTGDKPYMWYRRTISVPQEWTGRRLFVRFEAVRFVSEVYVDGQKVGGHYGGWEPFEVEVTKVCRPGSEHQLLVRVQDMTGVCEEKLDYSKRLPGGRIVDQLKNSIMAPIGSQGERVGIWQSTSLVARNEVYVEDVFVKTSVRRKEICAEVTVRNLGSSERTLRCSAAVEGGVTFEPVQVTVAGGDSKTVTLVKAWPAPRLWCPTDPHLYQLITRLELDGRELDRQATRFGFREFWTEGSEFVLNGVPMKFLATAGHPRGNLDSELSKEGALDLFRRIREAGCVAMRLHANIWPREWYEAADEVGLPVIMESALFCWCRAYAMTRDQFWKNYHEHLKAVIRAHRNHPSIVMISLENEILHCGGEQAVPGTTHRLAEAGRMVKALDPTRPILFDGDNDPDGVADVVNLHYPLNFNKQNLWPDVAYWLATGMEVACNPRCFWNWDRKKPLYMGEFLHIQHFNEAEPYSVLLGDDAFRGHREAMARAKGMAWEMQIEGYRATGLSGMCPWTLLESGPFPSDENPRYMAVKRAYQKNAAFIRQYDSRFYAGVQVDRKVYLYNDTPAKARLQCAWQLARGQQVDDQGQQTFDLASAQPKPFDICLHMPKVEQETEVTLTIHVQNGEKEVFTRAWTYRVYPRRPLDVPKGLRMAVFGQLPDNLTTMLQNAGATLTKLDRLDQPPQEGVILVAPHALDGDASAKRTPVAGLSVPLDDFVARGGSVVVLEQNHYTEAIPARLADRACTIAFRRSHDEGLMRGLGDNDFRFWRGDHVVARNTILKPAAGRFRSLVDSGGPEGLVYLPLLEIASGRGRYLLCQLAVSEKLDQEPAAQRVLENLLAAAVAPTADPSRLGVVQDKLPLGQSLTEIDAQWTNLSGQLEKADLNSYGVLLLETDSPETAAGQKKIAEWIRAGGRAILHGGTPEGLARLASLLPEPMALQSSSSTPVNIAQWDAAIDGLTNQELYWYGIRKGISHRQATPLSKDVVHNVVMAGLPESPTWAIVKPEAMTVQAGKARLRDGSMYMGSFSTVEAEVDFATSGQYAIGAIMKGTPLEGVYPIVDVTVDGQRRAAMAAAGKEWAMSWSSVTVNAGRHRVGLRFINDRSNPATHEDRNLWIKQLQTAPTGSLKSPALLSPSALVKASLGKGVVIIDQVRWEADAGGDKGGRYLSNLLTNLGVGFGRPCQGVQIGGDQFTPTRKSPGLQCRNGRAYMGTNGNMVARLTFARAGRYQFRIRASGTPAEGKLPNVALFVDGKRVGAADLVRTTWHTLVLEAEVSAGEHEIGMSLTNDLYRPPEDRNMQVDWMEIR